MRKYIAFGVIAVLLVPLAYSTIKAQKELNSLRQETAALKHYVSMLDTATVSLEHLVRAFDYKKSAQLYIMNAMHDNKEVHKALADSFKNECLRYKNSKRHE